MGFAPALETYVGKKLTVQITEVNQAKRNLVVSRRPRRNKLEKAKTRTGRRLNLLILRVRVQNLVNHRGKLRLSRNLVSTVPKNPNRLVSR